MSDNETKLRDPFLVAVWPGMGQVALAAGYYLLAKLEMTLMAEFSSRELFDIETIEVRGGLIVPGRLPRSRVFGWKDPNKKHDLLLFIGESQPPIGKMAFCQRLLDYAKESGVERVFTFAAMVTQMHPMHESRVFGVTTHEHGLNVLQQLELTLLEDGHIGGLNGVLLGVAGDMEIGKAPASSAKCRISLLNPRFPKHRWLFFESSPRLRGLILISLRWRSKLS